MRQRERGSSGPRHNDWNMETRNIGGLLPPLKHKFTKTLDKLPVIPPIVARSTTSEQNINGSAETSNRGSEVTVSTQITRQSQR